MKDLVQSGEPLAAISEFEAGFRNAADWVIVDDVSTIGGHVRVEIHYGYLCNCRIVSATAIQFYRCGPFEYGKCVAGLMLEERN